MQPASSKERAALLGLNGQRSHVLGVVRGLPEEALRRPVLPSGWNCLGLVHHLAVDDERFWTQAVIAGDPDAVAGISVAVDDGWRVPAEVKSDEVFALYRAEIERSNAVLATADLDASPAWWPDFFGDWRLRDNGGVLLHLMTETATHAGHLDAARELLDGRQWIVAS